MTVNLVCASVDKRAAVRGAYAAAVLNISDGAKGGIRAVYCAVCWGHLTRMLRSAARFSDFRSKKQKKKNYLPPL